MKKTRKIKLIAIAATAIVLITALVIPTVWSVVTRGFTPPSPDDIKIKQESEIAPVSPDIKESSFAIGEEIYTPEYTGDNTVPDGWMAIPEKLVPWLNGGAGDGWESLDLNNSTTNKAIKASRFTRTDDGLKVNIGGGDFALVMPTLKDSNGTEIDNYVYTVKARFESTSTAGSFGLVTGTRGSEYDFVGGTNHALYGPNHGDSWRYYHFGVGGRIDDTCVGDSNDKALASPGADEFTMSVYHCDGINYFFVNGNLVNVFEDKDYYNGALLSGIGLYFCSTTVIFKEISVKKASFVVSKDIEVIDASVRYCNVDGSTEGDGADGLRFTAKVNKTSQLYKSLVNGSYDVSSENIKLGMLIIPEDKLPRNGVIDIATPKVVEAVATKTDSQDESEIVYTVALLGIPEEYQNRNFVARAFIKIKNGDAWDYIYSRNMMTRNYASVANVDYDKYENEAIRDRLDEIFENADSYQGGEATTIKFALFSDFHYQEGAYISSIADLEAIFDRANENDVDFVLQAGDFCNDFPKSPELKEAYLNNKYDLPVYGVLGNHDLENGGTMATVTPVLTNKVNDVTWGTEDGKIGDGSIAYYYYEVNGFRIICCDSDYYYQTEDKVWKHYPSWYSGVHPDDRGKSSNTNSLGPVQLAWLENVLMDAADKDMPCIVVTHASVAGNRGPSQCSDHEAVRAIFKKANEKQVGTVLMAVNGHHHTNIHEMKDGILYLDMNTTRNGAWYEDGAAHYTDETFTYVEHNEDGSVKSTSEKKVSELANSQKTWFFNDPTSAIITVSSNGKIIVEGGTTTWLGGIDPNRGAAGEEPVVSNGIYYAAQH